jgi:hypothetical protein
MYKFVVHYPNDENVKRMKTKSFLLEKFKKREYGYFFYKDEDTVKIRNLKDWFVFEVKDEKDLEEELDEFFLLREIL